MWGQMLSIISFLPSRGLQFKHDGTLLSGMRLPELLNLTANLPVDLFLEVSLVQLNHIVSKERDLDLRPLTKFKGGTPPLDKYT